MADTARRTFIGSMGWVMGAVGVGAVGYTLFCSTETPGVDPRVRVDLPADAGGFLTTVSVRGRPVAVVGLYDVDVDKLRNFFGLVLTGPPFLVIDLVCTHEPCVVARYPNGWRCPCCGSIYLLTGRKVWGAENGPAKRDLAVPPHSFVDLYERLQSAGKPAKLALVAVMRKMIVTLNAMAQTNTAWAR